MNIIAARAPTGPTECSGCGTPFTPTAARHHRRNGSGMCRACQNTARHDNIILLPRLVAHIEQARARGLNAEQTAAAVGVDVAKVRTEWARQDALNAEVATL